MPSGGTRTGRPGVAYPNRGDLSGQPVYGSGVTQQAVRQATPGSPAAPARPQPTGREGLGGLGPEPGQILDVADDTLRPDEPVTTGLPIGPGAGPEVLGSFAPQAPEELSVLRGLYQKYPNEDLRRLIEFTEGNL